MGKYLSTVFTSPDKEEAEEQMHVAANALTAFGMGELYGAKVVHKAGVFQVEIHRKDNK